MTDLNQSADKEPIAQLETELKFVPSVELQLRLKTSLQKQDRKELIETILAFCELADATATQIPEQTIVDDYFDTEAFDYYTKSDSCRLRKKNEKVTLDIKKFISISSGKFERQESIYDKLSADERLQLEENGNLPECIYSAIPSTSRSRMNKVLRVINTRTSFTIKQGIGEFELSLDVFKFQSLCGRGVENSKDFFEIELETKNIEAQQKLEKIKKSILTLNGNKLKESGQSKYQVGVDALGLRSRSIIGKAYDYCLAYPKRAALVGLIVSIILAIVALIVPMWLPK